MINDEEMKLKITYFGDRHDKAIKWWSYIVWRHIVRILGGMNIEEPGIAQENTGEVGWLKHKGDQNT